MTCPADTVVRVVDGGLCAGAEHAPASSIAGTVNQHGRTPVDTTDWVWSFWNVRALESDVLNEYSAFEEKKEAGLCGSH